MPFCKYVFGDTFMDVIFAINKTQSAVRVAGLKSNALMESLIKYISLFKPITIPEQQLICSYFYDKEYKSGEYLFNGGGVCSELFFIKNGIVRSTTLNDKGVDVTHYFIGSQQFFTLLQSFKNETVAEDSIQACCNTQVLAINKKNLEKLYSELPFMRDLIDSINQNRLLEKIRLKNAYSGEDSVNRYKVFLQEQPDIANRVPLKDVASYLNITPQSLSRIRRAIK